MKTLTSNEFDFLIIHYVKDSAFDEKGLKTGSFIVKQIEAARRVALHGVYTREGEVMCQYLIDIVSAAEGSELAEVIDKLQAILDERQE